MVVFVGIYSAVCVDNSVSLVSGFGFLMALCTQIVNSGGVDYVALNAAIDPTECAGAVLLSKAEYIDWLAQLTVFGFDQYLFEQAFGAGLLLFVTGLGIGYLISVIRKLRV